MLLVYTPATLLALGVAKNMAVLLYLNHVTACLFYLIGKHGWVQDLSPGQSKATQYLTAMHWSLTNFQGNSEVTLQTASERLFAVISVWLAVLALASFGASLTNVMMQFRALTKERSDLRVAMLEYLAKYNISPDLGARLNYVLQWKTGEAQEDSQVLDMFKLLPKSLLMDLLFEVRAPLLQAGHPLFHGLVEQHSRAMRHVCTEAVSSMTLAPGEFVFHQLEPCSNMYFIDSGMMSYTMWTESTEAQIRVKLVEEKVRAKETLSEACLWVTTWSHHGDLAVIQSPLVLAVETNSFEKALRCFPTSMEMLQPYVRAFILALHKRNPNLSDRRNVCPAELDLWMLQSIQSWTSALSTEVQELLEVGDTLTVRNSAKS